MPVTLSCFKQDKSYGTCYFKDSDCFSPDKKLFSSSSFRTCMTSRKQNRWQMKEIDIQIFHVSFRNLLKSGRENNLSTLCWMTQYVACVYWRNLFVRVLHFDSMPRANSLRYVIHWFHSFKKTCCLSKFFINSKQKNLHWPRYYQ